MVALEEAEAVEGSEVGAEVGGLEFGAGEVGFGFLLGEWCWLLDLVGLVLGELVVLGFVAVHYLR